MSNPKRDQVLDNIFGRPGAAEQFRRVPKAIQKALTQQGVQHKAYKGIADDSMAKIHAHIQKLTDDPELQAKLHQTMAAHSAEKAAQLPTDWPDADEPDDSEWEGAPQEYTGNNPQNDVTKDDEYESMKEDPMGDSEAENSQGNSDRRGDLKSQPGYGEATDEGEEDSPPLVTQAITKRPGSFGPPNSHQETTGKGLKGYVTKREFKSLVDAVNELTEAMTEVATLVTAQKSFDPRRASSDPATQVEDERILQTIKSMNQKPDEFWHSNLMS